MEIATQAHLLHVFLENPEFRDILLGCFGKSDSSTSGPGQALTTYQPATLPQGLHPKCSPSHLAHRRFRCPSRETVFPALPVSPAFPAALTGTRSVRPFFWWP